MQTYHSSHTPPFAVLKFFGILCGLFFLLLNLPDWVLANELIYWPVFAGLVTAGILANVQIFHNVSAAWTVSPEGISESVSPKWKRLPFGIYQQRFVPWDQVESFDASGGVDLFSSGRVTLVHLHQGNPIRIEKNWRLGQEAYDALVDAIRNRGMQVCPASTAREETASQDAPTPEVEF